MARQELIEEAWRVLEPEIAQLGYELVEVEFVLEHGRWILRLFIDHAPASEKNEGAPGITLEDCETVSSAVNPLLDAADFIEGSYYLEVSSPGIDRPVRRPRDFERFEGEPIRLKAQSPVGGRKNFEGVLAGYQDGLVSINCDGEVFEVHIENLKRAHLLRTRRL
jgi:ribosome maturation factor RimP